MGNTFWGNYALEEYVCCGGARSFCAPDRARSGLLCYGLSSLRHQSQDGLSVVAAVPPRWFASVGQSFAQTPAMSHSFAGPMERPSAAPAQGSSYLGSAQAPRLVASAISARQSPRGAYDRPLA